MDESVRARPRSASTRVESAATFEVGWYRFRRSFQRRWSGYLSLILLVGLVGGLALGSLAAARRTASSFSVFWASVDPPDLIGASGVLNPTLGSSGYDPELVGEIAHLPDVERVESQAGIDFLPLRRDGAPLNAPGFYPPAPGNGYGSVDGFYFDIARATAIEGKLADPNKADQFVMSASAAMALGYHVGETVPLGIYTNAQSALPGFGTAEVKPYRVIEAELTGLVVFPQTVVEDDVDQGGAPNNLFTPALTRQLLKCCVNYSESAVQVSGGAANVASVQRRIIALLPKGFPPFGTLSDIPSRAQTAIEPETIALGVFGGIVALATLLIAAQVIGRQILLTSDEGDAMRAIGASPAMNILDNLIGIGCSVLIGSSLAVGVAIALSPLAPLGPVRAVYPYRGVSLDGTVLGGGFATLVVLLGVITLLATYRGAPHRRAARAGFGPQPRSSVVTRAVAWRLPLPAVTGMRFALEPGSGRSSVPVRSAVLGAVMAVAAIVGTVTFGASLRSLVSHPALYGWNWNYILAAGADIPGRKAAALLDRDRYVAAWSGAYSDSLQIDGQVIPVMGVSPGARVGVAILSGHGVSAANQVVLGAQTMSQLGKRLGDRVEVGAPSGRLVRLRIVGTASLPALGSGEPHLEMGQGAILSYQLIPAGDRNSFGNPLPGPEMILVRFRAGVSQTAAKASLQAIAAATSSTANFGVAVTGVLRPAEIVDYRSMGAIPAYLGSGLAAGAVAALALTLVASVRRRRKDLALLKTIGFTKGQLAATVACQAMTAVTIGVLVGVPAGIAVGRWLWDLFAREINAVPSPSVPVLSVVLIALGALVLANVVAAIPGAWRPEPPRWCRCGETEPPVEVVAGSVWSIPVGATDGGEALAQLLATLHPELDPGSFVFVTLAQVPPSLEWVAMVAEAEGITAVVSQEAADLRRLDYSFVASMITLGVQSPLEAVGLTAAVASVLASEGISCNVIAGFFHDHLFVPRDRALQALRLLQGLAVTS